MTKDCTEVGRRYCVSCRNDSHASWDRECPEFKRRVERMDEGHPENALTYFPTDEDWTFHSRPREMLLEEWFLAKYAVASLPPPTRGERQQNTRQIEGKNKKKQSKTRGAGAKGPMDDFLLQPHKGGRARSSEEEEVEDFFNSLMDEDITKQLNTGFNEE